MRLVRVARNSEATLGVLVYGHRALCLTLEEPWRDNKPEVSCIPKGTYRCEQVDSPKFGKTFQVLSVPGRSHILFHSGNNTDHTTGCILVGKEFGPFLERPSVLRSRDAFAEFWKITSMTLEFQLEVIEI